MIHFLIIFLLGFAVALYPFLRNFGFLSTAFPYDFPNSNKFEPPRLKPRPNDKASPNSTPKEIVKPPSYASRAEPKETVKPTKYASRAERKKNVMSSPKKPPTWRIVLFGGEEIVKTHDEAILLIQSGRVPRKSQVWKIGMTDWNAVELIPDFKPFYPPQIPDEAWSGDGLEAGTRKTTTILDVEYAFRWIPPGTFLMGSPPGESRFHDETQHQVTLTRGFWALETTVTHEMWRSVTGGGAPSRWEGTSKPGRLQDSQLPVECVSWNHCQRFLNLLNSRPETPIGWQASLPTEAQWEYACRAGTTTPFHFGNKLKNEFANRQNEDGYTYAVRTYPPNDWGLYEMHGNVWEWVQDYYSEDYYQNSPNNDPTNTVSSPKRVIRGGGHTGPKKDCRSARRIASAPSYRRCDLGFRFILSPSDQETQSVERNGEN